VTLKLSAAVRKDWRPAENFQVWRSFIDLILYGKLRVVELVRGSLESIQNSAHAEGQHASGQVSSMRSAREPARLKRFSCSERLIRFTLVGETAYCSN
jgi:hypothetical protein